MLKMNYNMHFFFSFISEIFYTQTLFSIHVMPLETTSHRIQNHMYVSRHSDILVS